MKRTLALLLCLCLLLTLASCKKKPEETPLESDQYTVVYAHDKLINRFFTEFAAMHGEIFYDVRRHPQNLDTFLAYVGECALSVRNASDTHGGIIVSIEGGTDISSRDAMLNLFAKVVRSADSSCSAKMATDAVNYLKEQTATVQEYRVSSYIRVLHYTPLVEQVNVNCRIELVVGNYFVAEE